jgi:hypothetical protein
MHGHIVEPRKVRVIKRLGDLSEEELLAIANSDDGDGEDARGGAMRR